MQSCPLHPPKAERNYRHRDLYPGLRKVSLPNSTKVSQRLSSYRPYQTRIRRTGNFSFIRWLDVDIVVVVVLTVYTPSFGVVALASLSISTMNGCQKPGN